MPRENRQMAVKDVADQADLAAGSWIREQLELEPSGGSRHATWEHALI